MKLATFVAKQGWETEDYTDITIDANAAQRGWSAIAYYQPIANQSVYESTEDEPVFILVKSADWQNYQVRNVYSPFASGTMLTEQQVREFIKGYQPN